MLIPYIWVLPFVVLLLAALLVPYLSGVPCIVIPEDLLWYMKWVNLEFPFGDYGVTLNPDNCMSEWSSSESCTERSICFTMTFISLPITPILPVALKYDWLQLRWLKSCLFNGDKITLVWLSGEVIELISTSRLEQIESFELWSEN